MKKKLIFITGGILIVVVCFLVYSCRKQLDPTYTNNTMQVPDDLLQAAKNWEAANTQNLSTPNATSGQSASGTGIGSTALSIRRSNVLAPNWNDAKLQRLSNGQTQIVVTSPDYALSLKSKWSVVRKFVYTTDGKTITGGTIIEMYSTRDCIATHYDDLIENYTDHKLKNFTGAIIRYDVNYHYLIGDVYNKGVKLRAFAKLNKDTGQHQKVKNGLFSPTSFQDGNCWDVYWVTTLYIDGVASGDDWEYLYSYCDGSGSGEYGNGGNDGDDPANINDCSADEEVFYEDADGMSDDTDMGSTVNQIDTYNRTQDHFWRFWTSITGFWYDTSHEIETEQSPDGITWNITNLTHVGDAFTGYIAGGRFSVNVLSAVPTIAYSQATMTLTYTTTSQFICYGVPLPPITGDQLTASKTWYEVNH